MYSFCRGALFQGLEVSTLIDGTLQYPKSLASLHGLPLHDTELKSFTADLMLQFLSRFPPFCRERMLFDKIDTLWRRTMAQTAFSPSLSSICNMGDLLGPFQTLDADLLVLNQSLNNFLERTRQAFPRLYFPSEPELLDILAAGYNNVSDINMHIMRLFPGVSELMLREDERTFFAAQVRAFRLNVCIVVHAIA